MKFKKKVSKPDILRDKDAGAQDSSRSLKQAQHALTSRTDFGTFQTSSQPSPQPSLLINPQSNFISHTPTENEIPANPNCLSEFQNDQSPTTAPPTSVDSIPDGNNRDAQNDEFLINYIKQREIEKLFRNNYQIAVIIALWLLMELKSSWKLYSIEILVVTFIFSLICAFNCFNSHLSFMYRISFLTFVSLIIHNLLPANMTRMIFNLILYVKILRFIDFTVGKWWLFVVVLIFFDVHNIFLSWFPKSIQVVMCSHYTALLLLRSVLLSSRFFTDELPRININMLLDGPQALVLELKHASAHSVILSWQFGSNKPNPTKSLRASKKNSNPLSLFQFKPKIKPKQKKLYRNVRKYLIEVNDELVGECSKNRTTTIITGLAADSVYKVQIHALLEADKGVQLSTALIVKTRSVPVGATSEATAPEPVEVYCLTEDQVDLYKKSPDASTTANDNVENIEPDLLSVGDELDAAKSSADKNFQHFESDSTLPNQQIVDLDSNLPKKLDKKFVEFLQSSIGKPEPSIYHEKTSESNTMSTDEHQNQNQNEIWKTLMGIQDQKINSVSQLDMVLNKPLLNILPTRRSKPTAKLPSTAGDVFNQVENLASQTSSIPNNIGIKEVKNKTTERAKKKTTNLPESPPQKTEVLEVGSEPAAQPSTLQKKSNDLKDYTRDSLSNLKLENPVNSSKDKLPKEKQSAQNDNTTHKPLNISNSFEKLKQKQKSKITPSTTAKDIKVDSKSDPLSTISGILPQSFEQKDTKNLSKAKLGNQKLLDRGKYQDQNKRANTDRSHKLPQVRATVSSSSLDSFSSLVDAKGYSLSIGQPSYYPTKNPWAISTNKPEKETQRKQTQTQVIENNIRKGSYEQKSNVSFSVNSGSANVANQGNNLRENKLTAPDKSKTLSNKVSNDKLAKQKNVLKGNFTAREQLQLTNKQDNSHLKISHKHRVSDPEKPPVTIGENTEFNKRSNPYHQQDKAGTLKIQTRQDTSFVGLKKSQTWMGSSGHSDTTTPAKAKKLCVDTSSYSESLPNLSEQYSSKSRNADSGFESQPNLANFSNGDFVPSKRPPDSLDFHSALQANKPQSKYNIFNTIPSFKSRNFISRSITDFDLPPRNYENGTDYPLFNPTLKPSSISVGGLMGAPLPFSHDSSADQSSAYPLPLRSINSPGMSYRLGNHFNDGGNSLLDSQVSRDNASTSYGNSIFNALPPSRSHNTSSFLAPSSKIASKITPLSSSLPFRSNLSPELEDYSAWLDRDTPTEASPHPYVNPRASSTNFLGMDTTNNFLQHSHRNTFSNSYMPTDYHFGHNQTVNENSYPAFLSNKDSLHYANREQSNVLGDSFVNRSYLARSPYQAHERPMNSKFDQYYSSLLDTATQNRPFSGNFDNKTEPRMPSNDSNSNETKQSSF